MFDLLQFFYDRAPDMVDLLRRLVLMESPSTSKEHVDKLGLFVAERCRATGADVTAIFRSRSGTGTRPASRS
jgi:dsDNA-binding SOS-regulon protein